MNANFIKPVLHSIAATLMKIRELVPMLRINEQAQILTNAVNGWHGDSAGFCVHAKARHYILGDEWRIARRRKRPLGFDVSERLS